MTIKKRLDRSRSFGSIHPPMPHDEDSTAVAHYTQDGVMFDHEGKLLEAFLTDEQSKALDKPKQAEAAGESDGKDEATRPQTRAEKLAQQNVQARPSGSDDLNLDAFLRGEEKYPEFRVKKVVRDRYNRVFNNMSDLVEFLVKDMNVMRIEDLKEEYRKMLVPSAVVAE